jgi:hypothetical protein
LIEGIYEGDENKGGNRRWEIKETRFIH